jgi:hypothetical protein
VINIGTSGWTKQYGLHFQKFDKNQVNWKETDFTKFHKDQIWFDFALLDILDRKNELGSTFFFDVQKKEIWLFSNF